MRRLPLIVLFAGTRPEAIKQAPLALAARGADDVEIALVHSGQHGALFNDGLAPFGLTADHTLTLPAGSGTPDEAVGRIRDALTPLLVALAPAMVVVQGDTSSALAGAIAAHSLGIPLAHLEAGLRSGDLMLPWPEEANRMAIARLADLHFAPSPGAVDNLVREGVPGRIHMVGNTGIDAVLHIRAQVTPQLRDPGRRHIVMTCHRRETIGPPLDRVAEALRRIVAGRYDRHATVLLHTNPAGMRLRTLLQGAENIALRPAARYSDMIALLAASDLVLSDSGGLQEECPALGVPLIVLRHNTERPEPFASGSAVLVGTETDAIVAAAEAVLEDATLHAQMSVPRFPYGTGDAAPRILDIIATYPFA